MVMRFLVPRDHHFTCSRCGDCCRSWNVALGPGEAETVRARDWSARQGAEDLVSIEPVVELRLPAGKVERLARRDDGRCVFLGAASQCRLHEHFGEAAKPLLCRLYPFGFHHLDDGNARSAGPLAAVDVSWACRAVAADQGAQLETLQPAWTRLLAEAGAVPAERVHWLDARRPLPGPLLWELEHHLLDLLETREVPFFDRLRCGLQFLRLATSGDPTTAAARTLRLAIARGLPKQIGKIAHGGRMDRTQRAFFYSWLYLALNPVPANLDLVPANTPAHRARQLAGDQFRERRGRPVIDGRPLGVDFAAVDAVDASLLAAHDVPLLERYFRARLVGQRFLLGAAGERPLLEAVPALYLVFPMAIWTSRALAAERGASRVEEVDLAAALRLLDRAVGQLTVDRAPRAVVEAWTFTLVEGDLVTAAVDELLDIPSPPAPTLPAP
jgi:lysine-N-methylase